MLNYSVYHNFEEGDIGVHGWSQLGDGVDLLGKHGAELVVKGICLVAIICDHLAICLQCGDANAFSLASFDE